MIKELCTKETPRLGVASVPIDFALFLSAFGSVWMLYLKTVILSRRGRSNFVMSYAERDLGDLNSAAIPDRVQIAIIMQYLESVVDGQ